LIENKENVFIVMELIRSGSLFDEINKRNEEKRHFIDEDASKVIGSLLSAISYIHRKNIVHRDIKPREFLNILKDFLGKRVNYYPYLFRQCVDF